MNRNDPRDRPGGGAWVETNLTLVKPKTKEENEREIEVVRKVTRARRAARWQRAYRLRQLAQSCKGTETGPLSH